MGEMSSHFMVSKTEAQRSKIEGGRAGIQAWVFLLPKPECLARPEGTVSVKGEARLGGATRQSGQLVLCHCPDHALRWSHL